MRRVLLAALLAFGFGAQPGLGQTNDRGVAAGNAPPGASANVVIASGALASNASPTSAQRVTRDGVASSCNAKAFPGSGAFGGGPYAYSTVSYTNSGPARCVTFTLNASCANGFPAALFLVAYGGAINPAVLSQNYLGDTGNSTGGGFPPVQMAVNLGSNQTINLLVEQVNDTATSPPSSCTYTLRDDTQVVVPTTSSAVLAAMAGMLALLGLAFLRRHPASR